MLDAGAEVEAGSSRPGGAVSVADHRRAREPGTERDEAVAQLKRAGEELQEAADAILGFFELAESSWAAGRRGKVDWN